MSLGRTAAKAKTVQAKAAQRGHERRYKTLCRVLDAICAEAPIALTTYHPARSNSDAVVQARSRALLHLYLKAKFGLIEFETRERFVTDGTFDGGIDAYYIDPRTKQIHVLQSKFRASASNFASSDITAHDLMKMDVARILKGGERKDELGNQYNERVLKHLVKDYQRVPDIANYTTKVVIIGNNRRFSDREIQRLVEGYAVDQLPHDSIYRDILFPVVSGTYYADPSLTIEITYEGNLQQVEHNVKAEGIDTTISLFFVPTREIGRIMSHYKNSILMYNPRSFLELSRNIVNQEIEASIRSSDGNNFALFNNGVTMISDGTRVSSDTAKRGVGQIVVTNPQLINGGQTAYTLATIYTECAASSNFSVFKGKQVLLKVITFVAKKTAINSSSRARLISDISRASNSQTKVDESDRRSNDTIQLLLQEHFFMEYGLYYERKKGEFSDGLSSGYIDHELLVKRDKLVRVALAADQKPHLARSSIAKFYKPDALSSLLREQQVPEYAYGYEVLKLVEAARKMKPKAKGDRFNTKVYGQGLRLGQYALVAATLLAARPAGEDPTSGLDKILDQWAKFEAWASKLATNRTYKVDGAFDYTNYYKGATLGQDIRNHAFVF